MKLDAAGMKPAVRPLLVLLLVAVVGATVAIGASGSGLLVPRAGEDGSLWAVRAAGAAAALAGLAWLMVQRRRIRAKRVGRTDATVEALVTAAVIMSAIALIARLAYTVPSTPGPPASATADAAPTERPGQTPGSRPRGDPLSGGFGLGRAGPSAGGATTARGELPSDDVERPSRIARILLLILLVAAALYIARLLRRQRAPGTPMRLAAADAEAGLRASWEEVAHDGSDPRRQITAAYHRLLAALAAAGAPPEAYEAPHEHLDRTLGPLGVEPRPMRQLTGLYVLAQFSDRPVTDRDRADAATALENAMLALRSARAAEAGA